LALPDRRVACSCAAPYAKTLPAIVRLFWGAMTPTGASHPHRQLRPNAGDNPEIDLQMDESADRIRYSCTTVTQSAMM